MLAGPLTRRAVNGTASVPQLVFLTAIFLLFLWAPIAPLSYYNFWWVLLILAPGFGLVFRRESLKSAVESTCADTSLG
jgi:hypothetical protein